MRAVGLFLELCRSRARPPDATGHFFFLVCRCTWPASTSADVVGGARVLCEWSASSFRFHFVAVRCLLVLVGSRAWMCIL